ncbi:MAG: histidinol-phosphate transaminase [Flavobacteriales bacterium]|nr:histidinol-phosphate transaminase [Flavobacteriales bacterium]
MRKLEKLIRPNILDLKPYSSARDEFKGKAQVFLDANENPFGLFNRYPDPHQLELKAAIAKFKKLDIDNIFVGNGSDEIIDLLIRIFCIPGKDNVLSLSPSYGMYEVSAAINDIQMRQVQLSENFELDTSMLLRSVDSNSKIIFICSPNNPTGNLFELSKIKMICEKFDGIVFVDEAYIDFADSPSAINLLKDNWNLIVSQTFSKARGLAAARVGYAMSNVDIINLLNKVKPPYNISQLNQSAALANLQDSDKYFAEIDLIKNERKQLILELLKLEVVIKVYPSEANFLLVEFDDANKIYAMLIDNNIVVRNRHNILNNCIRITIGSPTENRQLLNELTHYCNEKKSTIY